MGWWESKEGLLGDGPADLVEDSMSEWARDDARPSWQQFVDGLGGAIGHVVCARFAGPDVELRSDPGAALDRYRETLAEAIEQVTKEYEETQNRKPTVSEVLGTFAFSLRVAPDRFLRADGRGKLTAIYACSDVGSV